MPVLSMAQMEAYARGAGFAGNDVIIAGAVGMAESSGRTDAINFVPCVGIWQINVRAHPEYTIDQMKDPGNNARAAYAVFKSQGWRAWSTYTSGAYKRYLASATKASGSSATAGIGDLGGAPNPVAVGTNLGTIIKAVNVIQDPTTWKRAAFVIIGAIMIMMGLVGMSATPKNIKIASNLLPEGRALSAVKTAGKVAR